MKDQITREKHKIDASGKVLGRLATQVVILLRGKNKKDFTPARDIGDFVIINNVNKIKITGKKFEKKKYYHYSGYPGGLKETPLEKIFEKNPKEILRKAVLGMLPKNKLRARMIKRLKFE